MIVDASFFYGPLNIEGLMANSGADFTQAAIQKGLQQFIERYEVQYLIRLLGNKLGLEFANYLGKEEKEPEARWDNLLSELVPMPCVSPVANYVYFYYVRGNQVHATSIGATVTNSDNRITSCDSLIIPAWNEMVEMNRAVHSWLEGHKDEYAGFETHHELLEKINRLGV